MEDGGEAMLEEINLTLATLIVEIITAIIFFISIIFILLTFRSNRKFHRQRLLNNIVSEERKLKIKLNEYQEKIEKTKSKKAKDTLWNDSDTLLFGFYEYFAMLIIKNIINEKDIRSYFKIPLVYVFDSFYNKEGIFDRSLDADRKDYFYLRHLFLKWKIKEIFELRYLKEKNKD